MLSAVLVQVAMFVPEPTLRPCIVMLIWMLTFPHTVTDEQVSVASWLPDAELGLKSHVGRVTAKNSTKALAVLVVALLLRPL